LNENLAQVSAISQSPRPEGFDNPMACVRLPVSGAMVELRHPTGTDDLLVIESKAADTSLALALASRLARPLEGFASGWAELTVSDLDALILRLRQCQIGDRIIAEVMCHAASCRRRFDLSFAIPDYLAHVLPAMPRARLWAVESAGEPGWYRLIACNRASGSDERVLFRLPTAADQIAAAGRHDPRRELMVRCIRPADLKAGLLRRVEAAMAVMAPSLARELEATCPECGAKLAVYFNARRFCLQELRARAAFVHEEVDLLARRYHWSEHEILAMPGIRRMNYAELARQGA
jgi:hypothetical protein